MRIHLSDIRSRGLFSRQSLQWALYLVFVFVVFALLEYPNAIKSFDDYFYSFHFRYPPVYFNGGDSDCPLTSWSQLLDSQVNHYFSNNGRFIVHSLSQIFVNFWGYDMLCVAVGLLSLLTIGLLTRLAMQGRPTTIWERLLMILVFLLVSPWIFLNNTWSGAATFTLCYTIPTVGWLYAVYLFRHYNSAGRVEAGPCQLAGIALLGIVIGSLHEGYSVSYGLVMGIYCLRHLKRLPLRSWLLIGGLFVGSLIVIASPGIHHRAGEFNMTIRLWVMVRNLYELSYVFIPVVTALLLTAVAWLNKKWRPAVTDALRCSRLVVWAGVVEYLFTMFMSDMGPDTRAFTPTGIAIILYVGALAINVINIERSKVSVVFTAGLVLVISAITLTAFHYGVINRERYLSYEAQYRESPEGRIVIPRDNNGYSSPWTSGFTQFGVVPPVPWNPKFCFGACPMGFYYDKIEPVFRPDIDFDDLEQYRVSAQGDSIVAYASPGEWWIVIKGLPRAKKYEAYATSYRYHSPIKRLWKWIYPDDIPPIFLDSSCYNHNGENYVIVSRKFNIDIDEINVTRDSVELVRLAVPE